MKVEHDVRTDTESTRTNKVHEVQHHIIHHRKAKHRKNHQENNKEQGEHHQHQTGHHRSLGKMIEMNWGNVETFITPVMEVENEDSNEGTNAGNKMDTAEKEKEEKDAKRSERRQAIEEGNTSREERNLERVAERSERNSLQAEGVNDSLKSGLNNREVSGPGEPLDASPRFAVDYPGVEFLGRGYNLVFGNPSGDPIEQIDPGFAAPVVLAPSVDEPGPSFGYPERTCYQSETAKCLNSMSDYSSTLSFDASVSGGLSFGVGEASFSASYGSNSFQRDVVDTKSERYELVSYCLQYFVSYDEGKDVEYTTTDNFKDEALRLPIVTVAQSVSDEDHGVWRAFFDMFGTHFTSALHLGGKMVHQVTFDEETVTQMKNDGMNIAASVAASFDVGIVGGSVGASMNLDEGTTSTSGKGNSNRDVKTFIFGGMPPLSLGGSSAFGEWAATVPDRPMPIRYNLLPLDRLPEIDAASYARMYPLYAKSNMPPSRSIGKTASDESRGGKDKLKPGMSLRENGRLVSADGKVYAELRPDGDFIIYYPSLERTLWRSGSAGVNFISDATTTYRLFFFNHGGIYIVAKEDATGKNWNDAPDEQFAQLYDFETKQWECENCSVVWYIYVLDWGGPCPEKNMPDYMKLQNSGSLILMNTGGITYWTSGSSRKTPGGAMIPGESTSGPQGVFNKDVCT